MPRRAYGSIALIVISVVTGPASAGASPVCDRLRTAWATGASAADAEALGRAYGEQRTEIDTLEDRMRALGCSVGSVTVFGGPYVEDCQRLNALLSDMEENLDLIRARLETADSRETVAKAMRTYGCAGAPPPIPGVSQFSDPSQAAVEDLTPGTLSLSPAPEPRQTPSITHFDLTSRGEQSRPQDKELFLPPNLGPLPQGKARPMTETERSVRTVGPRFLPDPSQDLELKPSTGR